MNWFRKLIALAALTLPLTLPTTLHAQAPDSTPSFSLSPDTIHFPEPRIAVFAPEVSSKLARSYVDNDRNAIEHAYCARYIATNLKDSAATPIWYIVDVTEAPTQRADQIGVNFWCPDIPGFTTLHTHPPTFCLRDKNNRAIKGSCELDPGDWHCRASPIDVGSLYASNASFALIQCAKNKVITYSKLRAVAVTDLPATPRKWSIEQQKQILQRWIRWKYLHEAFVQSL